MHVIGWHARASKTLKLVLDVYPDEIDIWNDLGVKNLLGGRNEDARNAFQQVVQYFLTLTLQKIILY